MSTSKLPKTLSVLLWLVPVCFLATNSHAQLYIDGGTLFVQKNAVVKVETNLVTAKPGAFPPKMRNWGTIAVTGNTQFHTDTDYKGQGDLCLLGTSQQTLTTNGIPLKKLDIQNSNNVELGDSMNIQGELTLTSGFLLLGNHNLSIDDSVTITGGSSSSYIRINGTGKVKATVGSTPRTLPIGRNPYLPIIIDDGGGEEFTVGVVDDVYANPVTNTTLQSADVVSETWSIQASGAVSSATITLQWEVSEEETGFTRAASYLSFWENGVSTDWNAGAVQTASGSGPYSLSRTLNMSTNQYYFGVGGSGSALPVELTYFDAEWIISATLNDPNSTSLNDPNSTTQAAAERSRSQSALLTWETSVEINNSHFEIQRAIMYTDTERSRSGSGTETAMNWQTIGQVQGQGTVSSTTEYSFIDQNPQGGSQASATMYYRLKQVDFSGQFEYSDVRTLHAEPETKGFSIYPNPSNTSVLYVDIEDSYRVLSTTGKELLPFSNGSSLMVADLQKGVYIIENSEGITQLYIRN